MREKRHSLLKVRSAFIYVTEACNLRCAYCYFRHKHGRKLSGRVAMRFLSLFGSACTLPERFEISGGEPLLCWDSVRSLLVVLRKKFPAVPVDIQTNGLLLTAEKVGFISEYGIGLEFGIDGDREATTARRKKMGARGFAKLIRNIRLCVRAGIRVGCTMTVHPGEADRLKENHRFLRSLGIRRIDVTPAAFMSWDNSSVEIFQKHYVELTASPEARDTIYAAEDRECLRADKVDLSLHPPGYVLCGDAYLCLPERDKRRYNLWNPRTGELLSSAVSFFKNAYRSSRKGRKIWTYRDQVCAGFDIVNRIVQRRYINTERIVPLMRFLSRTHLSNHL